MAGLALCTVGNTFSESWAGSRLGSGFDVDMEPSMLDDASQQLPGAVAVTASGVHLSTPDLEVDQGSEALERVGDLKLSS